MLGPEIRSSESESDPTGAELHAAAIKLLTAKGKGDSYTASEYVEACSEVVLS